MSDLNYNYTEKYEISKKPGYHKSIKNVELFNIILFIFPKSSILKLTLQRLLIRIKLRNNWQILN